MYSKYIPVVGATALQVLDDLCAIIIGSTPIASLSASCDKVNSSIIASSIASNWTMHDAAASASAKVLKSLNADGTSYKYLHLSYATTTITLQLYESWNSTTHVGANPAIYATSIQATPQLLTVTTSGFWVLASSRNLFITQSSARSIWVGEFVRENQALDSTYPCTFICGCTYSNQSYGTYGPSILATDLTHAGICRLKYPASTGDLKFGSTPATQDRYAIAGITPFGSRAGLHLAPLEDIYGVRAPGSEQVIHAARSLYAMSNFGITAPWGSIALGSISEILCTSSLAANNLDEVTVDGVTCVVITITSSPKSILLVPKG